MVLLNPLLRLSPFLSVLEDIVSPEESLSESMRELTMSAPDDGDEDDGDDDDVGNDEHSVLLAISNLGQILESSINKLESSINKLETGIGMNIKQGEAHMHTDVQN